MPIQRLSNDLINQIAAGEVVERPAHLLKELVENSLDAGATEIEIELAQGGRRLKVKDNGKGIPGEELPLAVERHATSKIHEVEDLWRIHSFGFRGEALASSGAVSRLTLISRPPNAEQAACIKVEFGRTGEVTPTGGATGTLVSVESLFENIPARKKFLKSDSAELAQAKAVLKNIAMAHPHVLFRVIINGELSFYWPPAESRLERVKIVLEEQEMFESTAEVGGLRAHVVACSPMVTAAQSKRVHVFVNLRPVQDRSLQTAVIDAYRTLLMHGEYPVAAVFVTCSPDEVDVNIHPAKSQVKFRDPSLAFRVVHRATRDLLERAPWLPAALGVSQHREDVTDITPAPTQATFARAEFQRTQYQQREYGWNASPAASDEAKPTWRETLTNAKEASAGWSHLHLIGQFHATYILAQSDDKLLFIDQHAAHERVNFERLMRDFREQKMEIQQFLLPPTVELDEHLVEKLKGHFAECETRLGLGLDQMGPGTVAVRSAPALVSEASLVKVIEKMADELEDKGESFALENCVSELFATMACHSSIRAGQILSTEEMRHLLRQMEEFPLSSFCPHGRPVYVEYPVTRLERDFGRLV